MCKEVGGRGIARKRNSEKEEEREIMNEGEGEE